MIDDLFDIKSYIQIKKRQNNLIIRKYNSLNGWILLLATQSIGLTREGKWIKTKKDKGMIVNY